MHAEDLKLEETFTFADGHIGLHGRRLILHDVHALGQFRRDIIEMVGPREGRRILTRFGYSWGQADAAAMKRIFEWANLREWLLAGPRLMQLQGAARTLVKSLDFDQPTARFEMNLVWYSSGEAEEHMIAVGPSMLQACWILTGYLSGYATYCMGRNIFFLETSCMVCGDKACVVVGRDRQSWGAELTPHLKYFQADDIKGRILRLTRELRRRNQELAEQRRKLGTITAGHSASFAEVRSDKFSRVIDLALRVAPYDSSVLIRGETGVGKEVLARYIHEQSPRRREPFIAVNCSALPETLLESELFGHKAGAFTGATRDRIGLFETANKGTIFLDEIGDVTPAMQLKLLRVLQEKEILRVGESHARRTDVRVIAATNRNLEQGIADGSFRDDLYYRLRVIEIMIPPLRERREDIMPLARYFVKKIGKKLKMPRLHFDARCLDILLAYNWPGNVRELENAIERAAILSRDQTIVPEGLPPSMFLPGSESVAGRPATGNTLEEAERRHILRVLKSCDGNKSQAAKILGIGQATLWRKLKQIEASHKPGGA